MLFRKWLAIVGLTLLGIGVEQSARADDPPLDPEVVKAQLKQRRDYVQKLEEWVVAQREEVQQQMTDVVVGQQANVERAKKEYEKAKEATALARYKVREYVQGIFLEKRATFVGQIQLAQSDLERAIDQKLKLEEQAKKVTVDPDKLIAADLTKQQAELDVEQARIQLEVLEKYTKEKETRARQAAVAGAEAFEAEKQGLLLIEQAKESKLRAQTGAFHVRSPEDLVIALMEDAVKNEGQAVDILAECQKLEAEIQDKPAEAATLNTKLLAKKDEAVLLMKKAKTQLLDAANLAQQTKARRASALEGETMLKKERRLLETLENQLGPGK
jgi:hypothetical protein